MTTNSMTAEDRLTRLGIQIKPGMNTSFGSLMRLPAC
jgi:hypothetical protein